ncbi:MAG: thiol-disulfide isomerase/thioredoxin [Arenicella sp.]|jgi:thiol-disulfide isomerase/thioredoxin
MKNRFLVVIIANFSSIGILFLWSFWAIGKINVNEFTWIFVVIGLVNAVAGFFISKTLNKFVLNYILANILPFLFIGIASFLSNSSYYFVVQLFFLSLFGWTGGIMMKNRKQILIIGLPLVLVLSSTHLLLRKVSGSFQKKLVNNTKINIYLDYSHLVPLLNTKTDSSENAVSEILVAECWATWCKPCIQLLPTFDSLHKKYYANKNVYFMAVGMGGGRETSEKEKLFISRKKFSFPAYFDKNSAVLDSVKSNSIPCTIISKNDTIRKILIGNSGTEHYFKEVSNVVDSLLNILSE